MIDMSKFRRTVIGYDTFVDRKNVEYKVTNSLYDYDDFVAR